MPCTLFPRACVLCCSLYNNAKSGASQVCILSDSLARIWSLKAGKKKNWGAKSSQSYRQARTHDQETLANTASRPELFKQRERGRRRRWSRRGGTWVKELMEYAGLFLSIWLVVNSYEKKKRNFYTWFHSCDSFFGPPFRRSGFLPPSARFHLLISRSLRCFFNRHFAHCAPPPPPRPLQSFSLFI